MAIRAGETIPERFEKHAGFNWVNLGFNHKTTLTMGDLVPLGVKQLYPGEFCKVYLQVAMRFAALFLPIMHQCYFTIDWFYVRIGSLFQGATDEHSFERFMMQHPVTGTVSWAYFNYQRADATFTNGVLNYMGFNAPPGSGTLIASTEVSAIPVAAYYMIWKWMYRNPNIQASHTSARLFPGDNTTTIEAMVPDLRALKRNWPRDYYTIATPEPQMGANVLIPSFATDPVTGDYIEQKVFQLDGVPAPSGGLGSWLDGGESVLANDAGVSRVLQLSSTIRDFRFAAQMTEFLERATRSGAHGTGLGLDEPRWNDFVKRYFDWDPNPLMIDQPVWIGGYTGDVIISDVMSTAEAGTQKVGDYAGKATAKDRTPIFTYKVPDYGVIIPIMTVYPKASYYSGQDRIWNMRTKMDYMWEQFALIGDQPLKNKEVWFSWYGADVAWNEEIFGYVPQYHWERHSNDIVSGQMRTLWESFHLGRKFVGASEVVLNSTFIECRPDIGRVFDVDADGGEHECFVHAYVGIDVLRRLPKFGIPEL